MHAPWKAVCRVVVALSVVLSAPPQPGHALFNVATKFADVIMEQVQPGKLYNLRTMRNLPYRVLNHSDVPADLSVSIEIPAPEQLKPGYEAIADPAWIRIVPERLRLNAGEEGIVDIILQVPEGKAYDGRHFQAHIVCRTAEPPPGEKTALVFGIALASRLRFSVSSPGPEEVRRLQKKGIYQMLNFTLEPETQYLPGFVSPGQTARLSEAGGRISLVNRSPQKLPFVLKPVAPPDGMTPPAGYENGDPSWVTVKPGLLKVPGDTIKSADVEVRLPPDPALKGKRLMFVVQAVLQGREIPVEVYGRVYLNVEP